MTERIKILHIITNLPVGGAQDNTLITVERLNRSFYDVTLMCAPEGQWIRRALQAKDLKLTFVDELIRPIHLLYDVVAFWRIYCHIKKEKYTIVHTHSSKPGFLGRIAARLASVPIIIHTIHGFPFHDFMHPIKRSFYIGVERILSKITTCLVTVSKLNLNKAVTLRIAKREKFVNVYSGIDFQKFDLAVDIDRKREQLGIAPGEKIVGMVGRLSEQKAPWLLIRSVPGVLKRHPKTKFVIVGDGELMEKIKNLVQSLNIQNRVLLLGFREDISEIMQTFDVYVLTSKWEGLGRALTEAMYLGRPVVATNVEGVPEIVKHNQTGILVPPNNVDAIEQGITQLLSDPKKCAQLGKASREMVNVAFQAERMVRSLEQLYENMLVKKKLFFPYRKRNEHKFSPAPPSIKEVNGIELASIPES